ncbi:MAG: ABC transporter ATP-binding protein [Candidatus Aureabacteria bacterium]|nr:ABC transporter ATP-binding protein [Candidatus Auribacterota bacterium]
MKKHKIILLFQRVNQLFSRENIPLVQSHLMVLSLLSVIAGALEFVLPFLAWFSLDSLLPSGNLAKLFPILGIAGILYLLQASTGVVSSCFISRLQFTVPNIFRSRCLNRMLSHFKIEDKQSPSEYSLVLESDAPALLNSILKVQDQSIRASLVILGTSVLLIDRSPLLFCLFLLASLIHWFGTYLFSKISASKTLKLRMIHSRVSTFIFDTLSKKKVIHLFQAEPYFQKQYRLLQEQRTTVEKSLFWMKKIEWAWNNLFSILVKLGVAYFLAKKIMTHAISGGEAAFLAILLAKLQGSLIQLLSLHHELSFLDQSLARIEKIMSPVEEFVQSEKSVRSFQSFCFKNVGFSYSDRPVISGLSFEIHFGEKVIFFGPSGCGKTTIFNLMLGLLSPSSGEILLNGESFAHFSQNEWRSLLSMVPQENDLYNLDFKENILLGKTIVSENLAGIIRKAGLENAWSHAGKNPGDSLIQGEKSILSAGEARRVVLARGLANNSCVLFLDEADAHLEESMALTLMQSLFAEKDKTVVLFTHRRSLKEMADKVVELCP